MNTTENHTPGPLTAKWLCEALLVYRDHGGVPTQELVAEIMQRSAAPDLLEACKAIHLFGLEDDDIDQHELDEVTICIPIAAYRAMRAAIAKAEKGA